ncbi:MAG: hypothetical protein ACRDZ7_01535, partial [Acidimicrobiia bacterium]
MPLHRLFCRRSTAGTATALAVALSATLLFAVPGRSLDQAHAAVAAPAGYWMVATDGGIFSFGDAPFLGSTGAVRLNRPIVTMAPTPTGAGYWLAASDGGIFTFGDAGYFGSTGDVRLNKPIVAMAPTPSGNGYWLAASDGGIFTFGDAGFHGSGAGPAGADRLVGLAPTPSGRGYWQAFASGRTMAFGDAVPLGSTGILNVALVGMAPTPTGGGFWLVGSDGGIFSFGDAPFFGSTGATRLNQPIVGLAAHGAVPAAAPLPAGPAPTTPVIDPGPTSTPGPTTSTTITPQWQPPPTPRAHPADPDGNPPEVITEPLEISAGGASSDQVVAGPTTCGFPEMPTRTVWPDEIDYIGEASGMATSRRYPGVYWVVRDSGHTAAINAVRFDADGMAYTKEILVENAVNGDWEEVTYTIGQDGVARLWVVDNGGAASKKIYEIVEPDPDTTTTVRAVNQYAWAYPSGSYNTEAAFMSKGYLVLVTKTSPSARMYRFNTLTPGVTNKPTYIGKLMNSHSVSV